jgi:hypothetical protein
MKVIIILVSGSMLYIFSYIDWVYLQNPRYLLKREYSKALLSMWPRAGISRTTLILIVVLVIVVVVLGGLLAYYATRVPPPKEVLFYT